MFNNVNYWNIIVCCVFKYFICKININFSLWTTHIISTYITVYDTIKNWTWYLEPYVLYVFVKHQKWNNISVILPQHFSDRCHCFRTKFQSQTTLNLFYKRLVNVQFSISHISYLKLINLFAFLFINCHLIFHMPKETDDDV